MAFVLSKSCILCVRTRIIIPPPHIPVTQPEWPFVKSTNTVTPSLSSWLARSYICIGAQRLEYILIWYWLQQCCGIQETSYYDMAFKCEYPSQSLLRNTGDRLFNTTCSHNPSQTAQCKILDVYLLPWLDFAPIDRAPKYATSPNAQ